MKQTVNFALSRRSFMKSTATVGAAAALIGCSKNSDTEYVQVGDPSVELPGDGAVVDTYYGSSGHNCGGRCVSRAEVSKGRIQRILTDESTYTSDGFYLDPESRNFPQTRACAKCRGYRYRLYHPGRLLYPLKQTRKRGDLSGFVRISWEQALHEIATKHKTVLKEYGVDGVYSLYAWGAATGQFQGASGGPLGAGGAGGAGGSALRYMGGSQSSYFGSYSTHQYRYCGVKYTGMNENINNNSVAKYSNTLVLWGDNRLSTNNPVTYNYVRTVEDMKKRNPDAEVLFIGPEFVDGAVTLADEWIVAKPFTDPALIAGMIYHMLDNTFDLATGDLRAADRWLDVDYLDTMVYGFFDSPEYGLDETTGAIDATLALAGNRVVPEVHAGKSYCSWVLGNNTAAPTYSQVGSLTNYTAQQYATGNNRKRWAPCSYEVTKGSATEYKTKKDFTTPKTPAWASAITGVPEETIKRLAEIFVKNGPITSTWSGGQQKQHDGIANLLAVQTLHIVTKNVAEYGTGLAWTIANSLTPDAGALSVTVPRSYLDKNGVAIVNMTKAEASCTAWHTAIKMAFADELIENGYRAKYIPNWKAANEGTLKKGDGNIYWDDGGTKTFIMWKRDATGAVEEYFDGTNWYYDWIGREGTDGLGGDGTPAAHTGKPTYSGIRLMYNTGGNIFINQHENSNDSREMLEYLKLNKYDDPHTFCLVSFDNFMSPTPQWSDYVLPAATSWEQQDIITPSSGSSFYLPQVITPPGESKPTWDFANELLKAYEQVEPDAEGAATDFTGGTKDKTVESHVRTAFNTASANPASPYFGMKWEEYLKNPYLPAKPNNDTVAVPTNYTVMQSYKTATNLMVPLIDSTNYIPTNEYFEGGYGNQYADTTTAPQASWRFQVYSPVFTWQYVNRFSKWHGHMDASLRGQPHKDFEGDRIVLEIPLYYAYEDYFLEAYGNDSAKVRDLPFLLTTTHDRYRSHSSMSENPILRELTHRVPGRDAAGRPKQGNDYGDYAAGPVQAFKVNSGGTIPALNRTINADGSVDDAHKEIASYTEIWMNDSDGRGMGLEDGDLVQVENPVGAVRCVARLTKRCAKGFVGLHQGCWYDPRPLPNSYNHDSVDVGGNCNTLMASQPSRVDHGNGQQSALVKIIKVENY